MKTEYTEAKLVPVDQLTPYEKNAKTHDETQIRNIAKSIRQFGFTQPLVIDRDGVVVIGHGRLAAAKEIGLTEVPCIRREDLTDEEIRELRLLDNKLNESPWDVELLAADLQGLTFEGYELDFEVPEDLEPVDVQEDNWAPDLDTETEIQPGEIWALGDHRLMCGDSTDPDSIKNLMGGAEADLLLTDPPYNVNLGGDSNGHPEMHSEMKARKRRTDGKIIKNDQWEDDAAFVAFLVRSFTAAKEVMRPGAAFYIWHASTETDHFHEAAEESGLQVRELLVWVKNTFAIGRQDYQWRHELCHYGWKDGAGHYFAPTRKETTVVEDQIDPDKMSKKELQDYLREILNEERTPTTVLHEDKPTRSELHPTMKPVKLMARQIRNSSRPGEIVLDPFGGSGSTLIACEQMGRKCYTAELDPQYAQTIIDRWEEFTGRKAVRI